MQSYIYNSSTWSLTPQPKTISRGLTPPLENSPRTLTLARYFKRIQCSDDFNLYIKLSQNIKNVEKDALKWIKNFQISPNMPPDI